MKNYNNVVLFSFIIFVIALFSIEYHSYLECHNEKFTWIDNQALIYEQEGLSTDFCGELQNNRLFHLDSLNNNNSNIYHTPHELHYIWLTDENNPKEMPDKYKENIIKTINNIYSKNSNWHINLWTNVNQSDIRKTDDFFKNLTPNFKIRNISEFDLGKLKDNYLHFMDKKQYTQGSDIIRYNVLKNFGGLYMDLDYQLYKSIDFILDKYDFIAGIDDEKEMFIGAGLIGAKKNHPIVLETINVIDRNLNNKAKAPKYVLFPKNEFSRIIVSVGPRVLVPGVYKKLNTDGNKDYIASHGVFYDHPIIKNRKKIYSMCNSRPDFDTLGKIGHDPASASWQTKDMRKRICYKDYKEAQ